jgi:hypothetical protein
MGVVAGRDHLDQRPAAAENGFACLGAPLIQFQEDLSVRAVDLLELFRHQGCRQP